MALRSRAALIFAFGAALYLARVEGPYHFDDWVTPVSDPASQSLGAFVEHVHRTLRPLSKLSFALEGSLGLGDAPALRRAVSAAFHGASSALVFLLAGRLRAGLWAAFAAALLFAVHPIHGEMVWALAGRGAAMALSLGLGALLAQLRGRRWLAAALLLGACLSRETAIAFALPMAALELSRRGTLRSVAHRLEPCLTVVLLAVAFVAQNARYRQLIDYSAHGRPFGYSVSAQVEALPHGFSLYVRPSALSIDHGLPLSHSAASPAFWLGAALLVGLGALLVWAARARRPALAVGAALVLAALLPTQSVIPKLDPLTERPFATALAGAALLLAHGLRAAFRRARWRQAALGGVALTAVLLVGATLRRGALYASDVALWRDAARKSVSNARPHHNLAVALLEAGRPDEAREALARARRIDPFDSELRALALRLDPSLASGGPR